MIKLNGETVHFDHFPDRSCRLIFNYLLYGEENNLTFLYENDEELIQLYYLISYIKARQLPIYLTMPYIPNARQDRVKSNEDVFTLKYFCNLMHPIHYRCDFGSHCNNMGYYLRLVFGRNIYAL